MIQDPTLLFIYLATLLAAVMWIGGLPRLQPFFRILPVILFVYFLPGVGSGRFLYFQREDDAGFTLQVLRGDGSMSDVSRIDADAFHRLYAIAKMLRLD